MSTFLTTDRFDKKAFFDEHPSKLENIPAEIQIETPDTGMGRGTKIWIDGKPLTGVFRLEITATGTQIITIEGHLPSDASTDINWTLKPIEPDSIVQYCLRFRVKSLSFKASVATQLLLEAD